MFTLYVLNSYAKVDTNAGVWSADSAFLGGSRGSWWVFGATVGQVWPTLQVSWWVDITVFIVPSGKFVVNVLTNASVSYSMFQHGVSILTCITCIHPSLSQISLFRSSTPVCTVMNQCWVSIPAGRKPWLEQLLVSERLKLLASDLAGTLSPSWWEDSLKENLSYFIFLCLKTKPSI